MKKGVVFGHSCCALPSLNDWWFMAYVYTCKYNLEAPQKMVDRGQLLVNANKCDFMAVWDLKWIRQRHCRDQQQWCSLHYCSRHGPEFTVKSVESWASCERTGCNNQMLTWNISISEWV